MGVYGYQSKQADKGVQLLRDDWREVEDMKRPFIRHKAQSGRYRRRSRFVYNWRVAFVTGIEPIAPHVILSGWS